MAKETKPEIKPLPLEIFLIISSKNNQPCLEMRRSTTDTQLIKSIILAAIHKQPVIIQPTFTRPMAALATLIDKGILYRKDDDFFFNI